MLQAVGLNLSDLKLLRWLAVRPNRKPSKPLTNVWTTGLLVGVDPVHIAFVSQQ